MRSLAEASRMYLAERRRLGLDLSWHERTLRLLSERLETRSLEPRVTDVTREDLAAVTDGLAGLGLSRSSVAHAAGVLRVFCRWLVKRSALLLDPSRDFTVAPAPRRIGYVPTPAEVCRLIAAARPETALGREGLTIPPPESASRAVRAHHERHHQRVVAESLRDGAILELLYGSGLRFSEARKLEVADLDLSERMAFISDAKGGKDRVVPLTRASTEAISRYLGEARPTLLTGATSTKPRKGHPHVRTLFLLATGGLLSDEWKRRCLGPLIDAAGLPRLLTPHRLRHACALHLLENGADIVYIARLLGHGSLEATVVYLALTTSSLDRTLLAAHPRESTSAKELERPG